MDCPTCGTSNPGQARFCLNCGTALAPAVDAPVREERKVVTVLFADLVGFTARAERLDPEDVEKLLRPYHDRLRADIERWGGTVEKFIGDAVMAVFGAPTAHEDDAERAVRAALAIRDWAREQADIELRIAVNTGEALVNLDARLELGHSMVKGDVVNTAARLQAAAPVNGALVGEPTYRATSNVIDYSALEPVLVKGKEAAVPVWEALAARARFGTDVRQVDRTALVGRATELAALLDALGRALSRLEPQLVTLVGVPGIGKSRLIWELFKRLDEQPERFTWRQGRSLPYGQGISFWALGEMVKAQSGILESDSPAIAAAKVEASVEELLDGDAGREWVISHLRPLVGAGGSDAIPADRRTESFAAWRRYLEALAERRPLVLVFEDLHWADEGLLDFVDHLAEYAAGVPLLILATARPELLSRRPNWGGGKTNALTLSLTPLSNEATTELLHALLKRPVLAAEVQQALLERAGGNPLYAEEFVRLAEEGRTVTALPESVQAIIAARLDALPAAEKQLIQQAAVLGKVFWLGGLADVAGQSRWAIEEMLHSLERREFIRRERRTSVAAETEYAFRHTLIRDAAYEQLPRAERAERHRRAARWMESLGRPEDTAEMLAHHYLAALSYSRAAGRPTDDLVEPAKAALRIAGERAQALNSFAAAERFYGAALELVAEDDSERPIFFFGHARALHALGDPSAVSALATAGQLLDAAGDREHAAEAEVMIAELVWHAGDRATTDLHLGRAQRLIEGTARTPSRARVLSELSRYHMLADRTEQSVSLGQEALNLARELGLPAVEAHALNNIGTARFNSGDMEGLREVEESLQIALAADVPEAARSYNNLAVGYWVQGETQRATEARREALRTDLRYGRTRMARFAEGALLQHNFSSGKWDEFVAGATRFAAESDRLGGRTYSETFHLLQRSIVALARGQDEEALELARAGAERARLAADPQVLVDSFVTFAVIHHALGDAAAARRVMDEFSTTIGQTGLVFELVRLIVVALDLDLADQLRGFVTPLSGPSKWLRVMELGLNREFSAAAALLDEMEIAPDAAQLRLAAAEQLIDQGRRAEADEELRRALEFWRSVGAQRYIRRAEGLLSKAG